jgi:hypothetical protein
MYWVWEPMELYTKVSNNVSNPLRPTTCSKPSPLCNVPNWIPGFVATRCELHLVQDALGYGCVWLRLLWWYAEMITVHTFPCFPVPRFFSPFSANVMMLASVLCVYYPLQVNGVGAPLR